MDIWLFIWGISFLVSRAVVFHSVLPYIHSMAMSSFNPAWLR